MDRHGCRLIPDVRLEEGRRSDPLRCQISLPGPEFRFVFSTENYQRPMLGCPFLYLLVRTVSMHELGHGMGRLHSLLAGRQVPAAENVHLIHCRISP